MIRSRWTAAKAPRRHDQSRHSRSARRLRRRARSRRRRARRPGSTPRRATAPRTGSRRTGRSPEATAGSRRTAARVTPRRDLLEQLQPFPAKPYSKSVKPVTLPPGRARLSTKPAPTGSTACANTIGTVRVACSNAATAAALLARMTSGASATSSAAYLRMPSALPRAQR